MSIFMPKFAGDDYSAMQGPCPSGFHVPTKDELNSVVQILSSFGWIYPNSNEYEIGNLNNIKQSLLLPISGSIGYSGPFNSTSTGRWSCTKVDDGVAGRSYCLLISTYSYHNEMYLNKTSKYSGWRGRARNIRPFKDEVVIPDGTWTVLYQGSGNSGFYHNPTLGIISASSDGTNWVTIADKNLGATSTDITSTDSYGYYYQRGNNYGFPSSGFTTSSTKVDASSYGPGNYYNSSTFITQDNWDSSNNNDLRGGETGVVQNTGEPKKIYIRVNAQPITTSGIYHNSDLGLISLSSDGSTRITIADKNLGATQVYNDGDTLSEANCGKYYQWGNNYGFPFTGSVTTSSSQVNAQNYGPGNYYSSSTFIIRPSSPYSWDSSDNRNLWGGTTGTVEAMQGPCASGFHIPTKDENVALCGILINSLGLAQDGSTASTYLKMPYSGRRAISDGNTQLVGTSGVYRSSTAVDNTTGAYNMSIGSGTLGGEYGTNRPMGASIRPFSNEAVQPDDSRTKLY